MKKRNRRQKYFLIISTFVAVIMIVAEAVLEVKMNREIDENTKKIQMMFAETVSGAAVSESVTDTEEILKSTENFKWEYSEDFSLENMEVSIEELNQLPVYNVRTYPNTQKSTGKAAELFLETPISELKYEKKAIPKVAGALGGYEYTYIKEEENTTHKVSSETYFYLGYKREGVLDTSKKREDLDGYIKECVYQLKLGIWEGDKPLSEIKEKGTREYRVYDKFAMDIPSTDWHYQNAWDGNYYIGSDPLKFGFAINGELDYAARLYSHEIIGKTNMKKQYNTLENINECIEKMRKTVKRNDLQMGVKCWYTINKAQVRYCFIETKENDGHEKIVPIFELVGEEIMVVNNNTETASCKFAVGFNLDTGNVICTTTSSM